MINKINELIELSYKNRFSLQRIQEKRGKIKRERKKKFRYLRNTNQLNNYYKNKEKSEEPKKSEKSESAKPTKWYQLWLK